MKNKTIFAFDFSMSKPALCAYINGKLFFYCFPMNIDKVSMDKLRNVDINIYNRELPIINKNNYNSHSLVLEHIQRANDLSNKIIYIITSLIKKFNIENKDVIIATEGLSFASKGDVILDLSGYKYVLLSKLLELGFNNIKTYSPITIKSIAGCNKKTEYGKESMIQKITQEKSNLHPFIDCLKNNPDSLKKKTAFVNCVDDLVDAYWCLKTTIEKENLNIAL